jgi:leader peptidase (prepilin peptidase) / N-methyltransferase
VLTLALIALLAPVAVIDVRRRIIPNRLLLAGTLVALALVPPTRLPEHLVAAAGAGGFFLLAALMHPAGMGMGDVKLAAVLGLYLGGAVVTAVLVGLVAGALAGAVVLAREGRGAAIPLGPYLALGSVVALLSS